MATCRLLTQEHLSFALDTVKSAKPGDVFCLLACPESFNQVGHHKKKLAFWLAAMFHFAKSLQAKGFEVQVFMPDQLEAMQTSNSLKSVLDLMAKTRQWHAFAITKPNDYALACLADACLSDHPQLRIEENNCFISSLDEFKTWAGSKKQLRMEFFYRTLRQKTGVLMDGDEPCGGRWNFDAENRKFPKGPLAIPKPYTQSPDELTKTAMAWVDKHRPDNVGSLEGFDFPVDASGAKAVLRRFIEERLSLFGPYQDAMLVEDSWLYHSHIAWYLNTGLLEPMDCIRQAESAYRNGKAPLESVEGFIRQILGWREFVRGVYWQKMPDYRQANVFAAKRPLPDFYWHGRTDMRCLSQAVETTIKTGYAHHIQRLMVLGNFALLAGIDPVAVNDWFLAVYMDAFEWVETPNVTGMALWADGGYLASKPYAASGAYINKMSDYCKGCRFSVKEKNGPSACPFNYLYWNFLDQHQDSLNKNPRMAMIYRTYAKFSEEKIQAIRSDSQQFLDSLKS